VLDKCPTELEARTGLGIAVVIPTVLAGIGAAVALGQLDVPMVGVVVGVVGIAGIVGAVDRLMVTSPVTGLSMVLRVVMTLAMAWLIGEQFLLAAFHNEVTAELEAIHAEQINVAAGEIDTAVDGELARIDDRLAELGAEDLDVVAARDALTNAEATVTARLAALEELEVELSAEIAGVGTVGRTGSAGDGPIADQIRAEIDLARIALDEATTTRDRAADQLDTLTVTGAASTEADTTEIAELRAQRLAVEGDRDDQINTARARIIGADGIIARIEALERLARSPLMTVQIWALRLLLLSVDTLPITTKVADTSRRHRPYDTLHSAYQQVELHRADQLLASIGHPATTTNTPIGTTNNANSSNSPGDDDGQRRRPRGLVGGRVVDIEPGRIAAQIDRTTATYRQGRLNLQHPPAAA
jgi:hypothetical protein